MFSEKPASSVLVLGEEDSYLDDGIANFWLAEIYQTNGQGFTMKVHTCARTIVGCQIKNLGKGEIRGWGTREFRLSGGLNENGPWQILVEDELVDTSGGIPAPLLTFTFEESVEVKFLKFELISYWGSLGGGLQYFAPIPARLVEVTSKYLVHTLQQVKLKKPSLFFTSLTIFLLEH